MTRSRADLRHILLLSAACGCGGKDLGSDQPRDVHEGSGTVGGDRGTGTIGPNEAAAAGKLAHESAGLAGAGGTSTSGMVVAPATSSGGAVDSGTTAGRTGMGGGGSGGRTASSNVVGGAPTNAGGTSAAGAAAIDGSALASHAYDLKWSTCDCYPKPLSLHFTSMVGTTLEAVVGSQGEAHAATFEAIGPNSWAPRGDLLLSFTPKGSNQCESYKRLTSSILTIMGVDAEGSPQLSISGTLESQNCSDDYVNRSSISAELVGTVLARAPRWFGVRTSYWPAEGLAFKLDTPLEPDATASISVQDGASFSMTPTRADGAVVGFQSRLVLPLSSSITLSSSSPALNSNLTPMEATFATLEDPGFFQQDGFESESTTGIIGGVIASSQYGLASLNGTRSLAVSPGTTIIQLARPSGAQSARLSMRRVDTLSTNPCDAGQLSVQIGVVGALGFQGTSLSPDSDAQTVSDGTTDWRASATRELQFDLQDAGDTVLVLINSAPSFPPQCHRDAYAWVDDVRLE